MSEGKEMIEAVEITPDDMNKILDRVPMRVICARGELEYNFIESPTLADQIEMFQYLINTHRVYEYGKKTQKMCEALYRQGVLFDHTPAAVADGDENLELKRKLTKEEIMAEPVKTKKKRDFLDMWLCPAKKGASDE